LREREILLRVAPRLVRLVPFFIPVYGDTSRPAWKVRAGLTLYAALGGFDRDDLFARVPRREWDALDGLETRDLRAVFRYSDGQTDDAALVRAVLASARELGAEILCPARFEAARRVDGGYVARVSTASSDVVEIRCGALVNAAGPWVADVQRRVEPRPPCFEVDLVAGTHVELEGTLERGIYYCEAPRDRRAVFLMPWKGRLLVGTTETIHRGDPAAVAPTPREIEYLVETLRRYMPSRPARVLASWAGLRVLPRAPTDAFSRPRDATLTVDVASDPRLVAIWNGKLTGYRATAEKVLAELRPTLPPRARKADTATLALPDATS
jgi:glycerol-3-phosphate dehydrogenase